MTNAYKIFSEKLKERDHIGDLVVDGRTLLKWILEKKFENVDWINLAHDSDQMRALVYAIMKLGVSYKV
jgi:hypothetical protein